MPTHESMCQCIEIYLRQAGFKEWQRVETDHTYFRIPALRGILCLSERYWDEDKTGYMHPATIWLFTPPDTSTPREEVATTQKLRAYLARALPQSKL
jgi:hypothetical protein